MDAAAIDRAHSAALAHHLSATERAESEAPAVLNRAYEHALSTVTADDVLDNCADVADQLQAAMQAGDEAMVGRIVLAVRRAYAMRLAMRDVDGEASGPTNEDAVANLLIRRHAKAQARRFNAEPLTGFGSIA